MVDDRVCIANHEVDEVGDGDVEPVAGRLVECPRFVAVDDEHVADQTVPAVREICQRVSVDDAWLQTLSKCSSLLRSSGNASDSSCRKREKRSKPLQRKVSQGVAPHRSR